MTKLLKFFECIASRIYYIFILLQRKVEFKMKLCDENYFSSIFEKIIRKGEEKGKNVKKKSGKKRKNERWPRYIHGGYSVSSARVQKYRYFQKENEAACRGECVAKLKLSISWKKVNYPMTANISRGTYL